MERLSTALRVNFLLRAEQSTRRALRFHADTRRETRGDVTHQTLAVYLHAGDEYQAPGRNPQRSRRDPPRCHATQCGSGAASFPPQTASTSSLADNESRASERLTLTHNSQGSQSAARRCSETARPDGLPRSRRVLRRLMFGSSTELHLIGVCNNKQKNKKHCLTFWPDPILPLSSFLFCVLTV